MKILTVVILVTCLTGFTQTRRTRWEYTTETATIGKPAQLNKLGEEGWELVAVQTDGLTAVYFLKRPK